MRESLCRMLSAILFAFILPYLLYGSTDTIGPNGINSASLNLTGNEVGIGQVEPFRPGKPGFDTDAMCCNQTIDPTGIFVRDMDAGINESISDHPILVAGVMISTDALATGVATDASLYSSAYVALPDNQPPAAIAAQHLAEMGDLRAINMSFAMNLDSGVELNGDSLLTSFVDWSAFEHDVLYVVAGSQASEVGPVPSDNFNGMTVAMSQKEDDGVFRKVSTFNRFGGEFDAVGPRTSTDILAPGFLIDLTGPNGMIPKAPDNIGTSFAAPHVTGTVALLQEHAEAQIASVGTPRWTANARRHEVMKAVLMNSADKVLDDGEFKLPGESEPAPAGTFLGMERTVLKVGSGGTWFDSIASVDDTMPLDIEMGTGHLNAKRAVEQFEPGEYDAGGAAVPAVGWDLGFTLGNGDIQSYDLASDLAAGQFVSMTLAWDREVFLEVDADADGEFDAGDSFFENELPRDLNLYLMPQGASDVSEYAARSIAEETSVEHLFFEIDQAGEYEIWVEQASGSAFSIQEYALAWWTQPLAPTASFGDYDGDGTVGPEDYDVWKAQFGTTNAAADGNGDGVVDAADYTVWRDHLGQINERRWKYCWGGGAGTSLRDSPGAGWRAGHRSTTNLTTVVKKRGRFNPVRHEDCSYSRVSPVGRSV